MRVQTHQRISHTVNPDGLRIDYDYVEEIKPFVPTKKHDKFNRNTVQIVLVISTILIYILFLN